MLRGVEWHLLPTAGDELLGPSFKTDLMLQVFWTLSTARAHRCTLCNWCEVFIGLVFSIFITRCNQQQNCSILASTSMFGDPCPGTLKYLEAHYQCMPGMIDLLSMVMRLRLVKSVRVNKQGHDMLSFKSRCEQDGTDWRAMEVVHWTATISKWKTSAFIVFCHWIVSDTGSHRNGLDILKFYVKSLWKYNQCCIIFQLPY